MNDEQRKALAKPFPANKIKQKRGQGNRTMDYISHGIITERLNEVDPSWSWRTVAEHTYQDVATGRLHCEGVTIEMTVCGVARVEAGGPQRQDGFTNEIKNAYSDALKRAAMRFGVALGMWEALIDAEGDEDYATDSPTPSQARPAARGESNAPTPLRPPSGGGNALAAIHAAVTGKVEGEPHARLHDLAAAAFGVPSLRDLAPEQADRLRKALGECRNPRDGEAMIALAVRTNAATTTAELDEIARDIGSAGFGPERLELLRAAFRRVSESVKQIEMMPGNGTDGSAGADRWTN